MCTRISPDGVSVGSSWRQMGADTVHSDTQPRDGLVPQVGAVPGD
jgi:hypothetical protein